MLRLANLKAIQKKQPQTLKPDRFRAFRAICPVTGLQKKKQQENDVSLTVLKGASHVMTFQYMAIFW